MSTVVDAPLSQVELQNAILEFARERDTGYLGTSGPSGVHVSPVKYFVDPELNIYIHSRGGTKFDNVAVNQRVCLLISTPFADDFHQGGTALRKGQGGRRQLSALRDGRGTLPLGT